MVQDNGENTGAEEFRVIAWREGKKCWFCEKKKNGGKKGCSLRGAVSPENVSHEWSARREPWSTKECKCW